MAVKQHATTAIFTEQDVLYPFYGDDCFTMKVGGTTYEVTTHFNTEGTQSVLDQFKSLILSKNLI